MNQMESVYIRRAVLALGVALRVGLWCIKNFWGDTFALKAGLRTHSVWEILTGPLGFGQSSPICFSLVSKTIGTITGWNGHALSFPLLVTGIATLFVLDKLLDSLHVQRAKNLFLLLFAIHPSLVLYSAEFKPYGLDVLFASLLALFLVRSDRDKQWIPLVCGIAPLFSTCSFFLLPVFFLLLFLDGFQGERIRGMSLVRSSMSAMRPLVGPAVCTSICGIPALVHLFRTMPTAGMTSHWMADFAPLSLSMPSILWYVERTIRMFRGPVHFIRLPYFFSIVQVGLFLFPASFFAIGWIRGISRYKNLALFSLLLYGLVLGASAFQKWPIRPGTTGDSRLLLFFVPCVTCVLAQGVEWTLRKRQELIKVLAPALIISSAWPMAKLFYPRLQHSWNSEKAVLRLVSEWKNDDILVTDGYGLYILYATTPEFADSIGKNLHVVDAIRPNEVDTVAHVGSGTGNPYWMFHVHTSSGAALADSVVKLLNEHKLQYSATTNFPCVLIHLSGNDIHRGVP